ncbi:MAG TPA: PEP-CTERM sorting domain-containing protein [Verrucomicrobiae bacterium]|nr:PEP-CTERM sorting domain-containing protein [Verrucomicrobiae bacterium]
MKKTWPNHVALAFTLSSSVIFSVGVARAQDFDTPSYRGQSGTESAYWFNSFTDFSGGANIGVVAPGGSALANASIVQTSAVPGGGATPFILDVFTGDPASAGGIYGNGMISDFLLNYSDLNGTFSGGIGNVTFQVEASTAGTPLDLSSVALTYGTQTLTVSPVQFASDVYEWSWNLPLSDDVNSFSITFNASGPHSFIEGAALDISASPVPEPSTLALGGIAGMSLVSLRFLRRRFSN